MENFTALYSKEGFILIMKELGYVFQEDRAESCRLIFTDETNVMPSSITSKSIQFLYSSFGEKDLSDMLNIISRRNRQFSRLEERNKMQKELREFLGIK